MNSVGERLKGERVRLGYSVRKFADAAGVATSTQTRYESNENVPGSDYYNRISTLGAEIFWIMRGEKEDDEVRDKRAAMYSPDVRALIDDYQLCPEAVQTALRTLAKHTADFRRQAIENFNKGDKE
ncbi:MAG: helix-turn-helix transcriptional regulator [Methylicorpusculum sp.]|uniref:helix-turn-helix domain-containing protein n=1 Tax=Methylicorpusculum sp. TaxID=2713644 RepID=UPI002721D6CE|nr:helix-turn-helix transcriptional regulator [Methylicorpusculum sp.]MDO8941512.1 helix-turn-helix transcriptional regulator [Methylicorpusculum sp.]